MSSQPGPHPDPHSADRLPAERSPEARAAEERAAEAHAVEELVARAIGPAELERLIQAASERDRYLDHMQRMQAEMDNMRKRLDRDLADRLRQANAVLIGELLPAVDALDQALRTAQAQAIPAGSPLAAFVDGVTNVERLVLDAFRRHGLSRIDEAGVPFDPSIHAAVMPASDPQLPDQAVAAVLQAGYRLYDRLLRPAQVTVNRRPTSGPGA